MVDKLCNKWYNNFGLISKGCETTWILTNKKEMDRR